MNKPGLKEKLRRWSLLSGWATLGLLIYVGTFAVWWLKSPRHITAINGKQIQVVEFHYNSIFWHTEPLWVPAFWFVENMMGYELGGFTAAEDHSVQEFLK